MPKVLWLSRWLALITLCAWLLAACAGGPQVSPAPLAPGPQQLPPPSALYPRDPPARASIADIVLNGADYNPVLPNNLVEVSGTELTFNSGWTDGTKTLVDLAYATYAFSPGFRPGKFSIITNWSIPPDPGQFWIGLADNMADKWRWFAGSTTEPLVLSDMFSYLGMHTQLLVVIAITDQYGGPPPPIPQLATISLGDGAIQLPVQYEDTGISIASGSGVSDLISVAGNPAFAAVADDGGGAYLAYKRASDAQGTAWANPVIVGDSGFAPPSMAVVAGNPAVVYGDGLQYRRALDADGATWGDPVVPDIANMQACALFVVNGNPAIVYATGGGGPVQRYFKYIRALDATGATWPAAGTLLDPAPGDKWFTCPRALVINDKPVVAYVDYEQLNPYYEVSCVSAQDADGAVWNAPVTITHLAASNPAIRNVSLLDLGGVPGVGWFMEDFTDPANSASWFAYALDAGGAEWHPAQEVYGPGMKFNPLLWASYSTLALPGKLLAYAKGITVDPQKNETGEIYIAAVDPGGAVDWSNPLSHIHAYYGPPKSPASLGVDKRASCFTSWDGESEYATYDSQSQMLFVAILAWGILDPKERATFTGVTLPASAFGP